MKISLNEAIKLQEAAEERIRTGETPLFLVSTEHTNDIPAKSMDDLLAIASATKGKMVVQMAIVYGGTIEEKYVVAYDGDASAIRDWMFNKLDYKPSFDVQYAMYPEWGRPVSKLFETETSRNEVREFMDEFHKLVLEYDASVKALPYFLAITFNKANHVE